MDTVNVIIHFEARDGMSETALGEIRNVVSLVIANEPDCLGIEINQDMSDPARFLLYERWTSKEAYLGDHMQTPHIRRFIERGAEIFAGPPEITFWEPVS